MKDNIILAEYELDNLIMSLAKQLNVGDVILLYGDLGAGKTTFARKLIRYMMGNPELEVPSPTFTLVQQYETNTVDIWHFDLYRMESPDEILEIGFDEALATAVSIIEWPDRMGSYIPTDRLECYINFIGGNENTRKFSFKNFGNCKIELDL